MNSSQLREFSRDRVLDLTHRPLKRSVSLSFLVPFLATLLAMSFMGGCAKAPRAAKTLMLATESDPATLDPAKAYDDNSIPLTRILYRGLVDYDERANIVDEVARAHQISRDGKTYTFQLRNDVFFTSGRRVKAEDFRYALERVLDPQTASDGLSQFTMISGAAEFSAAKTKDENAKVRVRGIEVRGDDEIVFHLTKPNATFLNYLALPFAYAVPREHIEKLAAEGKNFGENPDGCGPFILEEWVHDGWIRFKKNPNYFHRDLPRSDRIEMQIGVSPPLQSMLFEQGKLDVLSLTSASGPDFLRLKSNPKWRPELLHAPLMDVRYLCLNTEMKPFDDVRVRQAMNYAINRDRIVSFLNGRATKARGALPPGMPAFNAHSFQYSYNPAKARELLKAAGYANGFPKTLTLWYSNRDSWAVMAAQSIQEDLRRVGVTISTRQTTYPELKAKAGQRHNIEMSMMGWLQDFTDPSNFLDNLFNSRSITDTASINRAFYKNPKVDRLLDAALSETDRAKRLKMYEDAEAQIVADAPWVFLHHTERYALRQPWIEDYTLHPMWSERYETVRVNDAKR